MIPAPFDYTRPSTVDEAVAALAEAGEDAKPLAGGQSLLPLLRLRMAAPSLLVDLGRIDELRGVRDDGDELVIGAMTTHAVLLAEPLVHTHAAVLAEAVATVADRQVRHLGTIGGSLAHADPAGDLPAAALAADATLELAGPSGPRSVAAADFFVDFLTTALRPDELLVAVRVPKRPDWAGQYLKFNRVAQAWATVGVAATVRRDNGTIAQARVALTNMGPTPVRARAVEEALTGVPANRSAIKDAARLAGDGTRPTSDVSASAEYRLHLAEVLTRRAVAAAAGAVED